MKHRAAIHLQITMFSCLDSHHAWAYQKKLTREGGVRDEERGTERQREPQGRGE